MVPTKSQRVKAKILFVPKTTVKKKMTSQSHNVSNRYTNQFTNVHSAVLNWLRQQPRQQPRFSYERLDIQRALGWSKSETNRVLYALQSLGMVQKEGNSKWKLVEENNLNPFHLEEDQPGSCVAKETKEIHNVEQKEGEGIIVASTTLSSTRSSSSSSSSSSCSSSTTETRTEKTPHSNIPSNAWTKELEAHYTTRLQGGQMKGLMKGVSKLLSSRESSACSRADVYIALGNTLKAMKEMHADERHLNQLEHHVLTSLNKP